PWKRFARARATPTPTPPRPPGVTREPVRRFGRGVSGNRHTSLRRRPPRPRSGRGGLELQRPESPELRSPSRESVDLVISQHADVELFLPAEPESVGLARQMVRG